MRQKPYMVIRKLEKLDSDKRNLWSWYCRICTGCAYSTDHTQPESMRGALKHLRDHELWTRRT